MSFTYDLTDNIGKVRLNIGDTQNADVESGAGVRWNGNNLQDAEIQVYLDDGRDKVDHATAHCLLMLASEYSAKATTMQMGAFREEMEMVATELRRQANMWFSLVRDRERDEGDDAASPNLARSGYMQVNVAF